MGLTGVPINLATCMVPSIAIGIAVDDTIHFLARYQRERTAGATAPEAVQRTFQSTGRAMVGTSVVLTAGFAVILVSEFPQRTSAPLGLTIVARSGDSLLPPVCAFPVLARASRLSAGRRARLGRPVEVGAESRAGAGGPEGARPGPARPQGRIVSP